MLKNAVLFLLLNHNHLSFYKLGNDFLHRETMVRDLGVTLQNNFSFHNHISNIIIDAIKVLGLITRNVSNFNNLHTLRTLYLSLVRPILLFASIIWFPLTSADIS